MCLFCDSIFPIFQFFLSSHQIQICDINFDSNSSLPIFRTDRAHPAFVWPFMVSGPVSQGPVLKLKLPSMSSKMSKVGRGILWNAGSFFQSLRLIFLIVWKSPKISAFDSLVRLCFSRLGESLYALLVPIKTEVKTENEKWKVSGENDVTAVSNLGPKARFAKWRKYGNLAKIYLQDLVLVKWQIYYSQI